MDQDPAVLIACSVVLFAAALGVDWKRRSARTRQMRAFAAVERLRFQNRRLPSAIPAPELISSFVRISFSNCCWGERNGHTVAAFDFTPHYRGEGSGTVAAVHFGSLPLPAQRVQAVRLSAREGWVFAVPSARRARQLSPEQIVQLWNELICLSELARGRSLRLLKRAQAETTGI